MTKHACPASPTSCWATLSLAGPHCLGDAPCVAAARLSRAARARRAALAEAASQHMGLLAAQLLAAYGVGRAAGAVWAPVVARLATEAAAQLAPAAVTAHGTLDPRFYVKARRAAPACGKQRSASRAAGRRTACQGPAGTGARRRALGVRARLCEAPQHQVRVQLTLCDGSAVRRGARR